MATTRRAPKATARSTPAKPARRAPAARKASPRSAKRSPARAASAALGIFSLGAAAVAIGAALYGVARQLLDSREGHRAPDLAPGEPHPGPEDRAPVHFRPDPTAPVAAADREALRPALIRDEQARPDTVH